MKTQHGGVLNAAVLVLTCGLRSRTLSGEDLWERALVLSVNSNHPAHDSYFIAAAEIENTQVVSFGKKLKAIFAEKVLTNTEFLSAGTKT